MRAVDTNVVVRYLVRDDLRQAEQAKALIQREAVWLAKSVLLETEWVLRGTYSYSPTSCAEALQAFLGLPTVMVEDESAVQRALRWFQAGLEFADALHLASSGDSTQFVTFDRKLVRFGKAVTGLETVLP
jgi:predicted nucleic-acid-binding protein